METVLTLSRIATTEMNSSRGSTPATVGRVCTVEADPLEAELLEAEHQVGAGEARTPVWDFVGGKRSSASVIRSVNNTTTAAQTTSMSV